VLGASSVAVPELFILLVVLVMTLAVIFPAGRICRRIGFSPFVGILAVVPIANFLLLWFVAMADWPKVDARG
jgi:hypothetical protein